MASVPILDFWGPYAERGVGGGVCVGVCGWDERMDAMHLSVFHSVANRTRIAPYAFNSFFFSTKRLYDIHLTWYDWFLRGEGDSFGQTPKLN